MFLELHKLGTDGEFKWLRALAVPAEDCDLVPVQLL